MQMLIYSTLLFCLCGWRRRGSTFRTTYKLEVSRGNVYQRITFYVADCHFIQHIHRVFISSLGPALDDHYKVLRFGILLLIEDYIPDILEVRVLKVRTIRQ